MSSFTLKPGLSAVFLPGAGRVAPGIVVTGEQFRRFVPQFLVEAPKPPVAPQALSASKPVTVTPPPAIVPDAPVVVSVAPAAEAVAPVSAPAAPTVAPTTTPAVASTDKKKEKKDKRG